MNNPETKTPLLPAETEVYFFHLQRRALETVLPKLLLKTLQRQWRACVWLKDDEGLSQISEALWTIPHEWILPHGLADEPYPERHPIWLNRDQASPNNAEVLFLCHGIWQQELHFPVNLVRVCFMIEPTDQAATQKARTIWGQCTPEQRTHIKV